MEGSVAYKVEETVKKETKVKEEPKEDKKEEDDGNDDKEKQHTLSALDNIKRDHAEQFTEFELIVDSDYDDYFAPIVRGMIKDKLRRDEGKGKLRHNRFIVSAGPWRSYDLSYTHVANTHTLKLDFYSVCRNRGGPEDEDLAELAEVL